MAMKPIKLKDLLTQTKKPVTQQIEIMEDYVLSVKTVFEGAVKDVPEDMLSKYCISDWYVRDETSHYGALYTKQLFALHRMNFRFTQNELRLYKKRRHFRQSHLTKTVCGIHILCLVHTRQNSTKIFV